ncbi:MAG: nicotinate phosphoribosyltransferase, partial [Desulfobacteraceae bacterium]
MKNIPLPEDYRAHTDKYFLRTREILEKENLNPVVALNVFCRGQGPVAGLEEALAVMEAFSDLGRQGGEVWMTRDKTFTNKQSLMIIRGPAQSVVELDTL